MSQCVRKKLCAETFSSAAGLFMSLPYSLTNAQGTQCFNSGSCEVRPDAPSTTCLSSSCPGKGKSLNPRHFALCNCRSQTEAQACSSVFALSESPSFFQEISAYIRAMQAHTTEKVLTALLRYNAVSLSAPHRPDSGNLYPKGEQSFVCRQPTQAKSLLD